MPAESSSVQSVADSVPSQVRNDVDADADESGDIDDLEVDDFEPPTELDDEVFVKEDKTENETPLKTSDLEVFKKLVRLSE